MRVRDIIGLTLALVLAVGVAFLTRIFLTKSETKDQPKVEKVKQSTKVLVAEKTLFPGDTIKHGDLGWQDWEKDAVVSDYLTNETNTLEEFIGSIVRFPIHKSNPIVREELVKKGEKSFLAAVISPGKRAVSIDVTPSASDSGLIFPGDYVDVIVSSVVDARNQQQGRSKTILKNVKVIALDTTLSTPDSSPKIPPHVATLEVTPAEAEVLMAGAKEGTLTLSLHSMEKGTIESPSRPRPAEKKVEEKKVILMRGKEKSTVEFREQ